MSYLLAISIGPVQDFIAAARKTRDLWYGSQLLSDLATEAARTLARDGAELIFPDPGSLPDPAAASPSTAATSIPNKLLASVPDRPAERAETAVDAARVYLLGERAKARTAARDRPVDRLVDWDLLDRQIDGFIEHYAAWCPYDPADPGGYTEARRAVERLLAGRKALRDFTPPPGRAGLPKSSLDPGRETVLRIRPRRQGGEQDEAALAHAGIKAGELLDGISLVKRLAPAKRFVSVGRVALDPLIRRLEAEGRLAELCDLARDLDGMAGSDVEAFKADAFPHYAAFPFDTQLFYDEEGLGTRDTSVLTGEERERLREVEEGFRARFRRIRRALNLGEPPAYLAVLTADGDRMGAALDGIEEIDARGQHRAFSAASAGYAREASRIVAKHQGAPIYSGGDDVLAFLPLDRAITCAEELREKFARAMAPLGLPNAPTLSVGIAIGHYSEPMSTLLEWARSAERHAKGVRDALAVAMYTRAGGAETLTRQAWGGKPAAGWEHWTRWFATDLIPDGAAYDLRSLARELRALHRTKSDAPVGAMLPPEVRRILSRKRGLRGTRALKAGEIEVILQDLPGEDADRSADVVRLDWLEALVAQMIIARRLADAQNLVADAQNLAAEPRKEFVGV